MENLRELQSPLLERQTSTKPFSQVLRGRYSAQEEPPQERVGFSRAPIWGSLVRSKSQSPTGTDSHLAQQLLEARLLRDTVEPLYSPGLILCTDWASQKDRTETTFTESKAGKQEIGNSSEPKVLELGASQVKLPTVSIDVEDIPFPETQNDYYSDSDSDNDSDSTFSLIIPQDYLGLAVFSMLCCFWPMGIAAFYLSQKTSKATAKGDYRRASSASRQALCTAVCSIALGVCTYVGGVVALAVYLSRDGHP
ncbi:transmembrane protein 91-like [Heptranchias perlo]|uniref:transmembrane protein 91-like n=1 Tax=Heptranchias perlo TaxID=212740 RepID=UPI00355A138A